MEHPNQTPAPALQGLPATQEPKYAISFDHKLVNRATGKAIPDDEPVMIFRAQDRRAVPVLWAYHDTCIDPEHRRVIKGRIADFEHFALEHPDRMKEPDSSEQDIKNATMPGDPLRKWPYRTEPPQVGTGDDDISATVLKTGND